MKKCIVITMSILLCGCNNVSKQEFENVITERNNARDSVSFLTNKIKDLESQIDRLSNPADARLAQIKRLMEEKNYNKALSDIHELQSVFPKSQEAITASELTSKIHDLMAQQKAEEERMKALGFKALSVCSTVEIGSVTASFSKISTTREFTFDAYGNEWHYFTADKNNKYVVATMSITSQSSDPKYSTASPIFCKRRQLGIRRDFRCPFCTMG